MVNNNRVGGAITILKNDGVRQWEGWHPIYEMEKKCLKPPTSNKGSTTDHWYQIMLLIVTDSHVPHEIIYPILKDLFLFWTYPRSSSISTIDD